MVSTMKIVDTESGAPSGVRVNRRGRRTYSREYKLGIVEACAVPGTSVAAIAMSHRINANLVRRWIVHYRSGRLVGMPTLLPVTLSAPRAVASLAVGDSAAPAGSKHAAIAGVIEIELEAAHIRVRGAVDDAALRTVLDVLLKR
jgi:transposase-like protein